MSRRPRQIENEEDLYAAAIAALARRAHSVYEMRQMLERRAADPALAPLVLARLKDRGVLDDARYARQFARDRAANRRLGPYRIARELRARGVADRWIDAALADLAGEIDSGENLRRRILGWLRRHGGVSPADLDRKQIAALYNSMLRAGFSGDRIRSELRQMSKPSERIPEVEDDRE